MGIYIDLRRKYQVPPHEWVERKLDLSNKILSYLSSIGMFSVNKVTVWNKTPIRALGGRIIEQNKSFNFQQDFTSFKRKIVDNYYRNFYRSVIRFEGNWTWEGKTLEGYFSLNNDFTWRGSYYDIELDCYGEGDIHDLLDLFDLYEHPDSLIKDFIVNVSQYSKETDLNLAHVFYSLGPPDPEDLESIIALHTKSYTSFLNYFYTRLIKEDDLWIEQRVKPYTKSFYMKTIRENDFTKNQFDRFLADASVNAIPGNSITYIGNRSDSLITLYNKFKEEIFKTTSQRLPTRADLEKIIKAALTRTSSLDKYQ